jgi:hypothetical protein
MPRMVRAELTAPFCLIPALAVNGQLC